MDIVYHALNDTSKCIIDASCCGAFKRKSVEEARDVIEDLEKCNMKAPSEFSRGSSRGKGGHGAEQDDIHGRKVGCHNA